MTTASDILSFWFGRESSIVDICAQQKTLWWSKNQEVDANITVRFKAVTDAVASGELDDWQDCAEGLAASIICMDQFPRNMYRGTAKSFAFDVYGLELANRMLQKGWDNNLHPLQRVFSYLPFEHSESLKDQETSVALFASLRDRAEENKVNEQERLIFNNYYNFALKHHAIVEEFGRFPHRNKILERISTDEEIEFLSQPGSSF